ncbi:hypothetical protein D6D20_09448 [Aureobasidium pullulans]|uniref:DUF2470 domain-containing protein n=1 Tax=Aureobasidium pullulans TaxID=5580 RepID=A0A4S8YS64_AURPU|nr:hypothetical protein D6D20_09448 [Aureobasidium pullulans]
MSDQASKDEAAKARIISHMNADHHDSVVRYLENYHHLPGYQAYNGRISDASLEHIAFECAGLKYRTALDPPMSSFREARERLVQMDKECLQALGRSDITVKEYISPTGLYLAGFVIVSTTLVAFSLRSNFEAGSLISAVVPDWFARFCWTIQPFIFYGMLVIHSAETWHMTSGRLRKHNVNVLSRIWWLWMGTTFIEGVGAYNRFDKMIKKKRAEKDKQKH